MLNIDVATLLALSLLWVDKDICRRRFIISLSNIQPPVHWVACDCIIAISLMKFWTTCLSCNHFCLGFLDSHASTMCITAVVYRAYWRSRWGAEQVVLAHEPALFFTAAFSITAKTVVGKNDALCSSYFSFRMSALNQLEVNFIISSSCVTNSQCSK